MRAKFGSDSLIRSSDKELSVKESLMTRGVKTESLKSPTLQHTSEELEKAVLPSGKLGAKILDHTSSDEEN